MSRQVSMLSFIQKLKTLLPLILLGCWTHHSDAAAAERHEFESILMGTRFRIVLYAPDAGTAREASRQAFERLKQFQDIMSDYDSSSELMRLCAKAGSGPVRVSRDLLNVLTEAQKWSKATDGAFDVTIGPVVQLWRRARRQRELPPPERLQQVLSLVGYQQISLNRAAATVSLARPGMRLDLGGIGKGFAADEALRVLGKQGIESAMIVAGGEAVVGEPPPGKKGWKIAVAPLKSAQARPQHYLILRNAAVSTSGDANQYVEIEGRRYSHIVDPKTGLGLAGRRSVTVVAARGATSDALATTLNVLGIERGMQLIETNRKTAALFVEATREGIQWRFSRRWKQYVEEPPPEHTTASPEIHAPGTPAQ